MGGDHGPSVTVPGVAIARQLLAGRNVRYILHGDQVRIDAELAKLPELAGLCQVRHTDRVISGDEKPAQALRRGKGSSLWNAVEAIRNGEAHGVVSGGNTGALMAISKVILRMIDGLDRPAIVGNWPTVRGPIAVLDVGANIDCDARQLVEFAIMGAAYSKAVHHRKGDARPTVGILNVGSEDMKGHQEVREAHQILRETVLDLDYRGFVEGNNIALGTVDVVVTDGFTGNVALKTGEGMARFFAAVLRETLTSSLFGKLGALVASGALKAMKARLDPSSVNGGPLLGLKGTVVKSHGGADARGVANAILVAANLAASDYVEEISRNMTRLPDASSVDVPPNGDAAASAEP
jgi:glycerol-3-phosphate acyltransferase PlsX